MELSARFLSFTTYGVQWVLWLLIGLSVISITVMLERLWYFAIYHPTAQLLAEQIRQLLHSGPAPRADAPESARIEALDAACEGAKARERLRLERNLAFLGTLGSNAPFVGLFGTVLGIIKAFHDLAGNQAGGPAVVMAGISEALVATAVGLMVAIPAVVGYNYFNRRIRTSMTEVDWMAHLALVAVKATEAEAAANPEAAAAQRVVREPRALTAVAWSRRMLPIGVLGALLLIFGGIWIGRSTSSSSRAGVAELPSQVRPMPATPAASPVPAPFPASSPPIYTPPSTSPSVAAVPATPGAVAGAAPPSLPVAGAPASALPAAPVPAVPALTPPGPVAAAPTPGVTPPAAVPPAATPPAAVQSKPVSPTAAPSTAAKPAAHPGAPVWRKGPKQWKGKKWRPQGAGKPAAKAPDGSATPSDKGEESPAKAPESAPAAPAVP